MKERMKKLSRYVYGQKTINLLLVMAVSFSIGSYGANPSIQQAACFIDNCTNSSFTAPPNLAQIVHPLLFTMAHQQPNTVVSVIVQKVVQKSVQKSIQNHRPEDLVVKLGGRVVADLSIINAFSAELKASDLLRLADSGDVRWISPDAQLKRTECADCTTSGQLSNTFIQSIGADKVWGKGLQGQDIGVAVVDSGVNFKADLYSEMGFNRVVASVAFHNGWNATTFDGYSHGTHVAGIIGGNGRTSSGKYVGVAPQVNFINVKVNDDINYGSGTAASLVQGLQWILEHKSEYNIRVVNISLNSSVPESYHTSPIDAAVEILWFNGIVVVVSAGNHGNGAIYPPANDPFVITVGATDEKGTESIVDDTVASFSAYAITSDGIAKPDLVAPGRNIVSLMGNRDQGLPTLHPNHVIRTDNGESYLRISGTSMAAPMVAGGVALLLQDEPELTPDQVKYRLLSTASKNWDGYQQNLAGAGYLDIFAAVTANTTGTANTAQQVSNLLTTGEEGVLSPSVSWNSVSWNSVSWNSVSWNSVSWNSVSWNSVSWNSDYWDEDESSTENTFAINSTPTATQTALPTSMDNPVNTSTPITIRATQTATQTALPMSMDNPVSTSTPITIRATATATVTATPIPSSTTIADNTNKGIEYEAGNKHLYLPLISGGN